MNTISKIKFGTDGIRGVANRSPITAEDALRIGKAAGHYFGKDPSNKHRVVIGKDTRRSGYMLENALTAGLTATGMNVLLLGPVPTPAVGLLTRSMRADLGIMISASHNPHSHNGIKFFGPDGYKLTTDREEEFEQICNEQLAAVGALKIGRAKRIDHGLGRYVEFAKTTFPKRLRLNGLKVVIDCANGAAYRAAPDVLWELGAEVIPVAVEPNGYNINGNCGSTNPNQAQEIVIQEQADVGICLDGDADRILVIDETGKVVNGDQLLALLANRWMARKCLIQNTLITTIMSSLGMEWYLIDKDIKVIRTRVGDQHITEAMREGGFNLGGENSGHIIMSDYTTTGDGLISGLQFLAELIESGASASELTQVFSPLPQKTANILLTNSSCPLECEKVKAVINEGKIRLREKGQLIVRQSGTENLVRIMVECCDEKMMLENFQAVEAAITEAI